MITKCEGCYAELEEVDGPTHRYIGASSACWAVYTELLATGVPPSRRSALVVDSYAAQHPGGSSPQATQSVAVHLVTLAAVIDHGHPLDQLVALRRAAVESGRRTGGYPKLEPVPAHWPATVADLAKRPELVDSFVEGVIEEWQALHREKIESWYQAAVHSS